MHETGRRTRLPREPRFFVRQDPPFFLVGMEASPCLLDEKGGRSRP
ncbi:hypothetical protein C7438_1162 [Brockia lithotrophica]|uniref:Uncharacterized protein n=1 Tax=Brockia lithotrophica TaxID=933949 RepID=A0A660KUL0_9BACL|nr:hypothetical protein C7438_1162 [Brockia lithotrophica]